MPDTDPRQGLLSAAGLLLLAALGFLFLGGILGLLIVVMLVITDGADITL